MPAFLLEAPYDEEGLTGTASIPSDAARATFSVVGLAVNDRGYVSEMVMSGRSAHGVVPLAELAVRYQGYIWHRPCMAVPCGYGALT